MIGEGKMFEAALKACLIKELPLLERYIEQKFSAVGKKTGDAFLAEYLRFVAANVAYVARTTPRAGRNTNLGAALKRINTPEILAKLEPIIEIDPKRYAMGWGSIALSKLKVNTKNAAGAAKGPGRKNTRRRHP